MDISKIIQLCSLNEDELKTNIIKFLKKSKYKNIYIDENYIIAEGDLPICLIAHMDTVFPKPPDKDSFFYDKRKKVLWSPEGAGFDDRAGIYAIMTIVSKGFRPHIIFTNYEELGCIGARFLIEDIKKAPFKCKALIQLDRAYMNDMVFYSCCNKEFEEYIGKFNFIKDTGSYSDISVIAPAWGIAAVNLSIGYAEEHTTNERLYCSCCDKTIEKVIDILKNINKMPYFKFDFL